MPPQPSGSAPWASAGSSSTSPGRMPGRWSPSRTCGSTPRVQTSTSFRRPASRGSHRCHPGQLLGRLGRRQVRGSHAGVKRAGAGDSKRCDQVERDVLERQAAGLRGAWRVLPAITQPKRSPGAYAAFGRHTSPVWRVGGCVCRVWSAYAPSPAGDRSGPRSARGRGGYAGGPAWSTRTHTVLDRRDSEALVELHGHVRTIGLGHVRLIGRAVRVGLDPVDGATGDRFESSRFQGRQVGASLRLLACAHGSGGIRRGSRTRRSRLGGSRGGGQRPCRRGGTGGGEGSSGYPARPPAADRRHPPAPSCADSPWSVRGQSCHRQSCRCQSCSYLLAIACRSGRSMAETMPTETGIPFWIAWRLALRLPAGHCLCDRGPRTESQRQFRGSTQGPHRRVLESERMNHEQRSIPHPPIRDWSTMNSPTTSASARQRARNKGLAWVSAITLGAGAASALGAAAIAITLPSPTAATGTVATGSTETGTTATGTTG